MNWDKIKPFISKFAPMIGAALGGPLGGAAGTILSNVLGIKDAKPEDVEAAIANGTLTGDQMVALRKAEDDFALQMETLSINSVKDIEALAVQDRNSARQREMTVKDRTPAVGFYFITIGFFTLLGVMLSHVVPEANASVLNVMVGSLGTAWISCVNYYYGSSSSSRNKDQLLYQSTPKQ